MSSRGLIPEFRYGNNIKIAQQYLSGFRKDTAFGKNGTWQHKGGNTVGSQKLRSAFNKK